MRAQQNVTLPEDRAAQASRSQTRTIAKQPIPILWRQNGTLASRVIDYLWPWSRRTFPGLANGVNLSLGVHVTWAGVRHWLMGRNRLPVWAAKALLAHVQHKVAIGSTLAVELTRYIEVSRGDLRHLSPGLRRKLDE